MIRVAPSELDYAQDGLYYLGRAPFTGVSFTNWPSGSRRSEVEYRDGHRWGTAREWYPDGKQAEEIPFRHGAVHGCQREWDEQGTLILEEACEHGIVLTRRELRGGQLVETYRLSEAEENYGLLQTFRAAYRTSSD